MADIVFDGTASYSSVLIITGNGGIAFGGVAPNTSNRKYVGSGELSFGGSATFSATFNCFSVGGIVFGGFAYYPIPTVGTANANSTALGAAILLEVAEAIQPITTEVAACSCDIPMGLSMSSNMAKNNALADFLSNNSAFPTMLYYSDDLWKNTLHFYDEHESWWLTFIWGCVDSVGGYDLGTNVWEFSMLISRQVDSQVFNTRLLITVPGANLCDTSFSAKLNLNFSTGIFTINDYLAEFVTYLDEIGLFNNTYWFNRPVTVQFFTADSQYSTPTFDISPLINT